MNTPTQMNRSSASAAGMTPSATESATALATAYCAGPNICTACLAPLMVTLLNITVLGLAARLGAITARSVLMIAPNLADKPNTVMFNKVTIKGAKQAVQ